MSVKVMCHQNHARIDKHSDRHTDSLTDTYTQDTQTDWHTHTDTHTDWLLHGQTPVNQCPLRTAGRRAGNK